MESEYGHDPQLVIEPAYYSGGVPVFVPTMAQFEDFYRFNKAINKYGMESGIVKVIPPRQWHDAVKKGYTAKNLARIHIKNPILQQINHIESGVFSQQNIERARKYDIFQWKELAERPNHKPPAIRKKSEDATNAKDDKSSAQAKSSPSPRKLHHHRHFNSVYNIDTSEFTPERCEELEKNYWRTLTYAEPMYGADMLGSIFEDSIKSWNVNHLPNILDLMDVKLPGVNDAYLYAGLWKATFAWHLEDQDLYSINYLHFGAPKQWYSIPQAQRDRFFSVMQDTFNDEYKNCPEFLRHKTFLVSPAFLAKHDITVNRIIHNEGEFMITYPYGYHAGFNYGYNLAESVNFALDDWFPIGKVSKKCECISDSVGINIKQIICKFTGVSYVPDSETEDNEEFGTDSDSETDIDDDDLKVLSVVHNITNSLSSPAKKTSKSRKRTKKQQQQQQPQPRIVSKELQNKRVKKTAKQENALKSYNSSIRECYLCPNNFSKNSLINVNPLFQLITTDLNVNGSQVKVHKLCANMFKNELTYNADKDSIWGLSDISKDQKKLQCKLCSKSFEGACFQCSYSKCTRSYHGTCGMADGVVYNLEASGKVLCKYHRTKKTSSNRVQKLSSLSPTEQGGSNSFLQFVFNGNYYFGKILRNNHDEHSFNLLVYPNLHEVLEISYDNILIGDDPNQLDNSMFINTFQGNYLNLTGNNRNNDDVIEINDGESQLQTKAIVEEHKNYISIPSSPQSELASSPRIFKVQKMTRDSFKDRETIVISDVTQADDDNENDNDNDNDNDNGLHVHPTNRDSISLKTDL